ncbi:Cytochrome P450 [Corchorus olitorius]|uniref:Cytochrome P450 n=1 Tax=Corchorus olitorius TaxID=93759 RepID=A0A1R3J5M3_9ROSI|nr:Cytochrome P450 [Corchorus olitorius]
MEILLKLKDLSSEPSQLITLSFITLVTIFLAYFKFKIYPLLDHVNKYGPVFKTSLMGSNAVLLIGQAGNRFIFSGKDNGIASNQVGTAAGILGKHSIFELPGPRHKIVRGAIMSFLKPEAIQRIVSAMDSLVQQELFQELSGKDTVKIVPLIKKITFKVGCSLLFRLPESKEKDELFEDFIVAIKGLWALPLKFPAGTHMDDNIFSDPEKFDPARFEVSSKLLPPYTYIPFGAGPRICPGAEYAKVVALLMIHHLIMNYQWTAMIPDEPILRDPMAYPAMGLPVKLQQKECSSYK